MLLFIIILLSFFSSCVQTSFLNNHNFTNYIFPHISNDIKLFELESKLFFINCSEASFLNNTLYYCPYYTMDDTQIATILNSNCNCTLSIKGLFLGRTWLKIQNYFENSSFIDEAKIPVTVIRNDRLIDKIFIVIVTVLVACSYVGMGCTVDLNIVKEVLLKPIAPIIGFLCQYLIMPLTAFAMVMLLGIRGGIGLGLFASGCAPGGGASNMYTFLLNGDVSLSVTMTLISTVASLGMYPLWLFTLGRIVYSGSKNTHLRVPFQNIIITLATMIIPVSFGLLIRHFCPKAATIIVTRLLRPFCVLLIIFLFTFGIYSNLYIIYLITPSLIIAACVVPWVGFLGGTIISLIFKQPLARIIAIAIETGVQNTGLPILLLKFSLEQPDADLSVVSPVAVACLMPIPLWTAIGVKFCYQKCKKRKFNISKEEQTDEFLNAENNKVEINDVNSLNDIKTTIAG